MTKKNIILLLISILMFSTNVQAQKNNKVKASASTKSAIGNNKKAVPLTSSAQEYINQYQFNDAITVLQRDIAAKKRKKEATELEMTDLNTARIGAKMLTATQKVIIVDSIVTDYDKFLSKIELSKESGSISKYEKFFNELNQDNAYVYVNEIGNKCYFSKEDENNNMLLYTSDKLDGKWSTPVEIEELKENAELLNYPFMMSDGTTFYFAATGKESLGGYDIFVTRYDSETGKFLRSENIGMPFNSPANDYMYAEDDLNNIGWFVTDRNQPAGKVCIYIFIPSDTREVYEPSAYSDLQIRRAAMISRIADTWGDGIERHKALARLDNAINNKIKQANRGDFSFVINNNTVYTKIGDFKSGEAKQLMQSLIEKKKKLQQLNDNISSARSRYAKAGNGEKSNMKQSILQNEQQQITLIQDIKNTEKNIRNKENTILNKR